MRFLPQCSFANKKLFSLNLKGSARVQCDQMATLLFQYLAIYNNENLTNSIRNLPKYVQNLAK